MRIVGLDVGTADLMYSSGSKDLVFCSNEKYWLELHRLFLVPPAHKYIRECWENVFDQGKNWEKRGKILSAYNNQKRGKILRNWDDVVKYYCILAMGGFSYTYDRWKLVSEHVPVEPDYGSIRGWYEEHGKKDIYFYRRNIYDFPTTKVDDNTLIYMHLPSQFAYYGCGYSWTKRKLEFISTELNLLAAEGYKICLSMLHSKRGVVVNQYAQFFDPEHFSPRYYNELKADRPEVTEAYLVANL